MAEGGSVNVTASGVVLTSGKPIRVYGYRMISKATGPGTLSIYDGTSASGTLRFQATGTASGSVSGTFGVGIKCVGGVYVTLDADVTSVDLDVVQEQST